MVPRKPRRLRRGRLVRVAALAAALAWDVLGAGFGKTPGSGDPGAESGNAKLLAAMAVQERDGRDLLDHPGVAGTAVALGPGGDPVIKVFLTAPGSAATPASLGGHPVVAEVTGPFRALGEAWPADAGHAPVSRLAEPESAGSGLDHRLSGGSGLDGRASAAPGASAHRPSTDPRQSFPRPVPIGVSAGQVDVTAGTIGARVRSGDRVFALSNNHVFANKNQANAGDAILQPGRIDGGNAPADAIARLHDFEPIRFCLPFPACPDNRIDAAIAATTTAQLGVATPPEGYGAPRSEPAPAKLGMAVQKYGRTTGHTTGRITGLNATVNVGFRDGTARFTGQIVIARSGFSGPGDSGSLIVSAGASGQSRRPVGLLFAGSDASTLANPIEAVLDRFGVVVDGN